MPRYRLLIEYDGSRYRGWQIQKNARTVQGVLQSALQEAAGEVRELYGSGRTDAGVHALGQVAHLELARPAPPDKLLRKLNHLLPADIAVLDCRPAPPRFHARHDAVARSYLYQISRRKTAFGKRYVWWVADPLNLALLRDCFQLYVGMKDFANFSADAPAGKSTRVLIEDIQIREAGDLILVRIEGSHFLWKMVRRMVGVAVEASREALALDEVERFLKSGSGEPARLTAPASGLFLERVYYPGDLRLSGLEPVLRVGSGHPE